MRNRLTGFTLIELLVVITIIVVLAALLFPVFVAAKAAAKTTLCISNMRQIGMASQLYLSDSDGRYYPASKYDALPGFAPQKTWIGYDNNNTGVIFGEFWGDVSKAPVSPAREGFIDPYIQGEGIKRCPNKRPEVQTALALNGFDPNLPSAYYAVNPKAQGKEHGPSVMSSSLVNGVLDCIGSLEDAIDEPSNTLLVWEHLAYAPQCNFLQSPDWISSPPNDQGLKDHFNFLHAGATTAVWCDGHAKRIVYAALKRPMFSVRKDIYP